MGVFVFVWRSGDGHLGLRGQVLHPGRQIGQGTLSALPLARCGLCAGHRTPLAFWRRWETVTRKDVPHRLVADHRAQIGVGPHNAGIAPGAILPCEADHQRFELLVDGGTAWRLVLLRAATLLGDQCAVPGADGGGCDHGGDVCQRLLPQLFPDLGPGLALGIASLYTPCDLLTQEAILGHEVLVA